LVEIENVRGMEKGGNIDGEVEGLRPTCYVKCGECKEKFREERRQGVKREEGKNMEE